jgi:hypothetical protein
MLGFYREPWWPEGRRPALLERVATIPIAERFQAHGDPSDDVLLITDRRLSAVRSRIREGRADP